MLWLVLGPLALVLVGLAWKAREPIPKQATLDAETGLVVVPEVEAGEGEDQQ